LRLDNNGAGTVWFDDLRIMPADAQMTTFTYKPLIGTSSTTDNNGITTYYDYDSYQRLMNVRDKDKKIIKHMDYNYKQ
jgi:YD repeat-containing protein